ncbi:MAG: DMT family transporter [Candidatus Edwardsbacteria bacterium]|nr:DMT family transporter [Candidatus Edwardsbacteria bacterium]MBU1577079.1 DMT family transporter [Candidatus Edwardsbacteria bacterium]MBU2462867.1 DMT family transporter [Candidatus Edwardsbacteria bacterium]MBU2593145.1 DMT family transporter [Candidatus Edwardsbacteria bacterium]
MKKTLLLFLMLLVVLSWGVAFVTIKYLLEVQKISAMGLTALRYVPAAAIVLAVMLVFYGPKRMLAVWGKEWRGISLYGITGVLGYNLALNFGETRIAAGTASLMVGLSPIFTLIASNLALREKITARKLSGIIISFIGLFAVVRWGTNDPINFNYLWGVLITLGAPISWTIYNIVGKPVVSREDPNLITMSAILWGSLPLVFFIPDNLAQLPAPAWWALAFLTLVCTIFGFLVWSWALKHTEAARLGAVVYLIPLVTVISSIFLLGEKLTAGLVIGGLILIGGVILAET